MEPHMLFKVREFNREVKKSIRGSDQLQNLCEALSEITGARICILNSSGKLLGNSSKAEMQSSSSIFVELVTRELRNLAWTDLLQISYSDKAKGNQEGQRLYKYDKKTSENRYAMFPIVGNKDSLGAIFIECRPDALSDEDLVFVEFGTTIAGLKIQSNFNSKREDKERKVKAVEILLNTLSYSEHEAITKVFEELGSFEGTIIVSKIANETRITRTIIVNAIRKLVSASIVESRSLGMKGTYIRVLNKEILDCIHNSGVNCLENVTI